MERATNPHLIEEAETLLREYSTKLSLESISIFKEDGTFLYSSDPSMHQQEGTESLFEVLDGFYYAFEIEEIRAIMVYNHMNCLIITPMYLGNWGEVEGWMFAFGCCEQVKCSEMALQLRLDVEKIKRENISENLTIKRHEVKFQRAVDFPKILGREFEENGDSVVLLDGSKGFVMQTYGEAPWGITTRRSGRKYPEPLHQLDEDLTMKIHELGIGVPPYEPASLDEPFPMETEILETLDSEREPIAGTGPDYTESNKILKILLVYSAFMALTIILLDVTSLYYIIVVTIVVDVFLLVSIGLERISRSSNPCCSCIIFLMGILLVWAGISSLLVNFGAMSLLIFLLGIYGIIAGVLAHVTRSERMSL